MKRRKDYKLPQPTKLKTTKKQFIQKRTVIYPVSPLDRTRKHNHADPTYGSTYTTSYKQ